MKIKDIMETTAGATSAGSVATVVNPKTARGKKSKKKNKPTDNALDKNTSLFSGEAIKR